MMKTLTQAGRPKAVYRASNGDQIVGLYKLADGRWRISGKEKITFSEPDERIAIARFYETTSAPKQPTIDVPITSAKSGDTAAVTRVLSTITKAKPQPKRSPAEQQVYEVFGSGNPEGSPDGQVIRIKLNGDRLEFFKTPSDEATFFAWLRQLILTEGEWLAQKTGVASLAWLPDLKRPAISPTLESVGKLYADKPGLSINESSRSVLFWKEFVRAVGVATVGEVTHDHIAAYEKKITGSGLKPKSILHRYRKVRTVLAYAIKRGQGVEDCRKLLDITAMLEVKDAQPLDPTPIGVSDFWSIHKAAVKAEDETYAALLLVAMNCAMYPGEVACLRWEELNLKTGELLTRRPKTGVSRVAILWPETIRALKALPQTGEHIFNTRVRSFTVFSALDCWRKYRDAAGVSEDVKFGMIRDAAYLIAFKVSLDQARVLAGHRLPGMADSYIRRSPQFVAEACKAIHDEVFRK